MTDLSSVLAFIPDRNLQVVSGTGEILLHRGERCKFGEWHPGAKGMVGLVAGTP